MGLKTTHGCWSGPYSSFGIFRRAVARACDVDLERMEGFSRDAEYASWDSLPRDPIHALLNHSDCDGEIATPDLIPLADRLDAILPRLKELAGYPAWIPDAAVRFAEGCREAAAEDEPVKFA